MIAQIKIVPTASFATKIDKSKITKKAPYCAAVAKQYIHNIEWKLTKDALDLPAGVTPVASCQI